MDVTSVQTGVGRTSLDLVERDLTLVDSHVLLLGFPSEVRHVGHRVTTSVRHPAETATHRCTCRSTMVVELRCPKVRTRLSYGGACACERILSHAKVLIEARVTWSCRTTGDKFAVSGANVDDSPSDVEVGVF